MQVDMEMDMAGEKMLNTAANDAMETKMEAETRVYRSRYFMLFLFVTYSMSSAFQWIEFSIIANIVSRYYEVKEYDISWTAMTYMIFYIPLIVPANWILEKKGLRFAVLLGSFGTCAGSWVKCCSLFSNSFAVVMVGQSIVAASQVFILGIPSQLAGVWFGATEVSRACAIGVFGNQLGIALGFLLPPLIVPNSSNMDDIEHGLSILLYGIAAVTSAIFISIVFFFKEKPPLPPSRAQAAILNDDSRASYFASIWKMLKNVHYMLLLVTYGINVGVFYAISTFLNQMVLFYNKGAEESAGLMGLIIVLSGMVGSVVCGVILDKTHKFKETTLVVYILSFLGMVSFAVALPFGLLLPLFFVSALLGFFMTGYLPLGFEFAAEITYPEAESISSGLLNMSAQVFGIVFTAGSGALLDQYGDKASNISLCVCLLIGAILTAFIKSDLRRLKASQMPDTHESMLNSI
ncbi:feline leukemia virus subgroup C receptor-related protein 2-like isoform X2 [Argiope bruennichi]|uniref:feline leukemia virus subgroup C receptor-related protein 2-like isoform X2 n=1 Tax=Argiope bruennichi TaxID=94029 RepID=UPI0024940B1B|nr:feline leukemia virus subgroup C receptor-related protein 2-like isoform X2 [Argiope bruennichi]